MKIRNVFLGLILAQTAFAAPWYTGPLLAPAGKTIPPGHINVEPYSFYSQYNSPIRNVELTPVLTVGLANFLDFQMSFSYDFNWYRDITAHNIGDMTMGFGFQLLRQKEHDWIPNLRMLVQETFPTGRFDHLDVGKFRTDKTGFGAYQTSVSFNFQWLAELNELNFLRTRLSLVGSKPSEVRVYGLNAYGGNATTRGKISRGISYAIDYAMEYTLTQHWVPVFEMLFVESSGSGFIGDPGFSPGGTVNTLGGRGGNQLSLAPALEYNFSAQLGIIAGVWFSATGPQSNQFRTFTLALNYFF